MCSRSVLQRMAEEKENTISERMCAPLFRNIVDTLPFPKRLCSTSSQVKPRFVYRPRTANCGERLFAICKTFPENRTPCRHAIFVLGPHATFSPAIVQFFSTCLGKKQVFHHALVFRRRRAETETDDMKLNFASYVQGLGG